MSDQPLCTEKDIWNVDNDARELALTLPPSRLKCSKCKGGMVSKQSIESGLCLWCRPWPTHTD